MVLQKGTFWDRLQLLRTKYEIEPQATMPKLIPKHEILWPRFRERRVGEDFQRYLQTMGGRNWLEDLEKLFDGVIPLDLRLGVVPITPQTVDRHLRRRRYEEYGSDRFYRSPWAPFLSACGLFNPPHDQLLDFAAYGFEGEPLEHIAEPGLDDARALPLRYVRDADAVQEEVEQYWIALVETIRMNLLREHGIDIEPLLHALAETTPPPREHHRRLSLIRPQPVIDAEVVKHSNAEEIRAAVQFLRGDPDANQTTKAGRTDLECVQCAVWRDEFSRRWAEIAEPFGWGTQDPNHEGQELRSETARSYVAAGRRILKSGRSD